jgi:hypothetical protein
MNFETTSGPLNSPQRIVLYGANGVGKSSLAAQAPDPRFLDTDDNTKHLNVRRLRIKTLEQFETFCAVSPTRFAKEGVRTLVVDPINQIEKFQAEKIARTYKVTSIAKIRYGNGFTYLREEFDRFITEVLDAYIAAGIHVVVISESTTKRVQPLGLREAFDRHILGLDEANSRRLRGWADAVLFYTFDLRLSETGDGRPVGISGKERQIWTQYSPAFDAKNRVGLPEKLEATFEAIRPVFCDYEPTTPQQRLLDATGNLDTSKVIAFLVKLGCLQQGQTIFELSDKNAREILRRLPEFKGAIIAQQSAPPPLEQRQSTEAPPSAALEGATHG